METVWTEWHLTPDGWIAGMTCLDFAGSNGKSDPPVDRCLTCAYEEFRQNPPGSVKSVVTERWRSDNKEQVDALLRKFGECPRELHIYPKQLEGKNSCFRVPEKLDL